MADAYLVAEDDATAERLTRAVLPSQLAIGLKRGIADSALRLAKVSLRRGSFNKADMLHRRAADIYTIAEDMKGCERAEGLLTQLRSVRNGV